MSASFTKRVNVHPSPEDLRAASDHLTVLLRFEDDAAAWTHQMIPEKPASRSA
jgi:hypothetical protein